MFGWPGRLCADQFQVERDRDTSCDFVLHGEQIARVAVEPLRPEVGRILASLSWALTRSWLPNR
jgi:hypothetical protein